MIEPLFVPVPPAWTAAAPWSSGWLSPAPGAMSPLPLPNAAVVGAVPPQSPVGSASMLVAAVALRRGQPNGPTTDQDVEELIYDTLELLPGASDVEARCEGGRVTLSGSVSHKRLKRDIGEIAWSIPSLVDVMNNVTISSRRRARGFAREGDTTVPAGAGRKQT